MPTHLQGPVAQPETAKKENKMWMTSAGQFVYTVELGTCVLASTRRCDFLVLVLALFQITYVLSVKNVYNSLVV